jgi:hypothetical protein
MSEFDIIVSSSTKIDKVIGVGYKYRSAGFSYESLRILGSDVTRTKNQLVYILTST